jgi:hypothetical protein
MIITIIVVISLLCVGVFLHVPSYYNPLTLKGEAYGIFVEGKHKGYGDFCGQYPITRIRFRNATYNKKHFHGEKTYVDMYFGNQWTDVDKMKEGVRYKIWYHEESRPSDTTGGDNIHYWVIDGYEKL